MYFRRNATPIRDDPADDSNTATNGNEALEKAFFYLLTSTEASGHKQARAYLALMLENGLIPSGPVIHDYTAPGREFEYLNYLTDLNAFIKPSNYSLAEFKQEFQSKALVNLYLSSLTDLSQQRSIRSN
jgi:hypothetical protein